MNAARFTRYGEDSEETDSGDEGDGVPAAPKVAPTAALVAEKKQKKQKKKKKKKKKKEEEETKATTKPAAEAATAAPGSTILPEEEDAMAAFLDGEEAALVGQWDAEAMAARGEDPAATVDSDGDDVEDDGAEEDEAALGVDESATESAADADARTTSATELPAPPLPPPPLPTGAPDVSRSAAAATASRATSVAALEPAALHALLACVGVPLLELAFFRRGGADLRLANAPPCELPRRIIRALALVARLPRRITASSTSRSLASAGAGAPNWSALGAAQRDALLTALAHPDALLAPADLEELKRFALFRIPSGEHVSIDSGGFYTSSEEVRCSFLLFAAILCVLIFASILLFAHHSPPQKVDGVATLPALLAGSAAERRVLARRAMPVAHLLVSVLFIYRYICTRILLTV